MSKYDFACGFILGVVVSAAFIGAALALCEFWKMHEVNHDMEK